jgi:hypothetical protein
MTDNYSDIGLNSQLNSVNCPLNSGTVPSGYTTESSTQTGAISSANLRSVSWGKASGGTATLGGLGNGDGLVQVNNSAGTPIVTIDKSGITIASGSLSVLDSSGTTIMDSGGVTSASFLNTINNEAGVSQNFTTSGTINSGTMSLVLARATNVLCLLSFDGYMVESAGNSFSSLFVSVRDLTHGTVGIASVVLNGGNDQNRTYMCYDIGSFPSGTTNLNLYTTIGSVSGTPSFHIGGFKWAMTTLGK